MRFSTLFAISAALFAGLSQTAPVPSYTKPNDLEARSFESLGNNLVERDFTNYEVELSARHLDLKGREEIASLGGLTLEERDSLVRRVDECSICLQKIRKPDTMVTMCQNRGTEGDHAVCRNCMETWIMRMAKTTCPVCREPMGLPFAERVCKSRTPSPPPLRPPPLPLLPPGSSSRFGLPSLGSPSRSSSYPPLPPLGLSPLPPLGLSPLPPLDSPGMFGGPPSLPPLGPSHGGGGLPPLTPMPGSSSGFGRLTPPPLSPPLGGFGRTPPPLSPPLGGLGRLTPPPLSPPLGSGFPFAPPPSPASPFGSFPPPPHGPPPRGSNPLGPPPPPGSPSSPRRGTFPPPPPPPGSRR